MTRDVRALADMRTMPTYQRLPVLFESGEGVRLFDEHGMPYLDFVAGIAVNALGHAHPAVTEAVSRQASRLVHTSNLYYTGPMAELADRLCGLLGFEDGRIFFANSGAEANECALKLTRRRSLDRYGPGHHGVIAARGSFHGRTMHTLAATGQPAKWGPFAPLAEGFVHVDYGDSDAVEAALTGSQCAVLLEPIEGEAGVVVPDDDYLPQVRRLCGERGLALVLDEVQTGLGRTGEWFGFQHTGAVPDVVTIAKALGNGLPIGACAARGEWAGAFRFGDHATTMGGGPVVCSAALAVLDVIEAEDLVANARSVGAYLAQGLERLCEQIPIAVGVRGRGLLLALQLGTDCAGDVMLACLRKGLLVNNVSPSALRFCPPLTLSEADCDQALQILEGVLIERREAQPA